MTTKDKTRQKLVGSMRKTKAVAGIGTDSTQAESEPVAPEVPVTATQTAVVETKRKRLKTDKVQHDTYRSKQRVWPD